MINLDKVDMETIVVIISYIKNNRLKKIKFENIYVCIYL